MLAKIAKNVILYNPMLSFVKNNSRSYTYDGREMEVVKQFFSCHEVLYRTKGDRRTLCGVCG